MLLQHRATFVSSSIQETICYDDACHLKKYAINPARGFPDGLKSVSGLERGEFRFYQRGPLVASVWMDNKPVTMLSTLAQPDATHTALRKQRNGSRVPVQCSDAVVLYNQYMSGVDRGDQLRQYYRVRMRCYKNYK